MKNMKMTVKLSVSFLIVIAFAVIVGGMGIYGIQQINTEETHLYEDYTQPLPYIGKVSEIIQRMRVDANEYLIGALTGDMDKVENARSCMQNHIGDIPDYLNMYRATIEDADALLIFDETRTLYDEDFLPSMERCYELAKAGDSSGVLDEMDAIRPTILKIAEDFNACMETKTVLAGETSLNGDSYARMLTILVISTLAIGMAVSVFLIFYISGLISKPLGMMSKALNQMGTEGDLALSPEMAKSAAECAAWKDEIGLCARAVGGLIGHLNNIQDDLARVADGDLTISINTLSERDSIGLSVSKLVDSLNEMFGEINSSATQLSAGSKQIADGAQSLAQGTTEQASAVEELSSSIAEIDKKTKDNAEMADKAALLANSIMLNAEKGSRQMDEMMTAVRDINEASQSINKVIKVIDNIAFQTNILALNAAVEAARAGQHGKGFAVVAEEVRSLAAKSAEAAKDTENLIANSIEKAELGARITDETAASLKEIVSGISESAKLVNYIAKSSDEQSVGISQINTGINQVAQVVHKNSATAQESAAASEEMSGQAGILESLVAQFMLKNSGAVRFHSLPPAGKSAHETLTMPGYGAH